MHLLRNTAFRRFITAYALLSLACCAGVLFINLYAGLLVFAFALISGLGFCLFTRARYRQLAALSEQLNRLLHGDYLLNIADSLEGEAAILKSELYKVTVRLREQAEALERDKLYLRSSIADISHQIRTPLTSIHLILPQLRREAATQEERQALLRELATLLSQIDWLITALLKISQIESGTVVFRRERVRVASLVQKACQPLAIAMELREQTLHVEVPADAVFCGDLNWTSEALLNILKNCMEHTKQGGHIHIAASANSLYTQIVVSDDGAGIDEADLPHLFERFYKGSNRRSGSVGIGLNLSRMIISAQNGTLQAANNPNGGARFTMRLYAQNI